jgi:orotidine-5'-phosphate decarboxylase
MAIAASRISRERQPDRRKPVEKGKARVIIALDTEDLDEAGRMIELTRDRIGMYKVGSILFTKFGPDAVRLVKDAGCDVFLDLKFHDIPNTVKGAVRGACGWGVDMLTVHASGGIAMMAAALEGAEAVSAAGGTPRPRIVGVTVLTSLAGEGTLDRVLELADDARHADIDGVVCSPGEVKHIKQAAGRRLVAVVPGVRLPDQKQHDQLRVGTPAQAARDGADFIVVGRSVTAAPDPRATLAAIVEEVENA